MPDISPYSASPDSLANRLVGTAGMNTQAGKEYFSFAQGVKGLEEGTGKLANEVGSIRDKVAAGAMANQSAMFSNLHTLAHALGAAIGKGIPVKAQQNKLLNNAAVTQKAYEAQTVWDDKLHAIQQQYQDDPENAVPALKEAIENNSPNGKGGNWVVNDKGQDVHQGALMSWAQNDPTISKDPGAIAHLTNQLSSMKAGILDKMTNWAWNQRTKNAEAVDSNISEGVNQTIASQTGPLQGRIADYTTQVKNADQALANLAPTLGQAYVSQAQTKLHHEAAATYFGAGVTNRPDDPVEALSHLSTLKAQLASATTLGMPLTDKAKLTLEGHITTAENAEYGRLQKSAVKDELNDHVAIADRAFNLDLQRKDIPLQQSAIQWAADQVVVAKKQIAQIDADPTLNDNAKIVLKNRMIGQLKQLDGLVHTAHTNITFNEAEANKKVAEATREANANRRDANHLAVEQRRMKNEAEHLAHQQLMDKRNENAGVLSDMKTDMTRLLTNPIENQDLILKHGAAITNFALKGRAEKTISPEVAAAAITKAQDLASEAATFKQDPGFYGFFSSVQRLHPDSTKGGNAMEGLKAQQAYLAKMETKRLEYDSENQTDTVNKHVVGMNPEQMTSFNQRWAAVQADPAFKTLSPSNQALAKVKLQNKIMAQPPAPTSKVQSPGSVSPAELKALPGAVPHAVHHVVQNGKEVMRKPPDPMAAMGEFLHSFGGSSAPTKKETLTSASYDSVPKPSTMIKQGNLDLTHREKVSFPNGLDDSNSTPAARASVNPKYFPKGSYGSEFSVTIEHNGDLYIIPSIFHGKLHSEREAAKHFEDTGEHMGVFPNTPEGIKQSEEYSTKLHLRKQFVNGKEFHGDQ